MNRPRLKAYADAFPDKTQFAVDLNENVHYFDRVRGLFRYDEDDPRLFLGVTRFVTFQSVFPLFGEAESVPKCCEGSGKGKVFFWERLRTIVDALLFSETGLVPESN